MAMGWEILWPLVLGFGLSAFIQARVSHRQMSRLLPDDKPRTLVVASALGAASSSCSYAAVALARSLFRKGADFTAAMAFEIASTNLVVELGIIMALLLGWQFTAAEFVGGPLMIVLVAVLLRRFAAPKLVAAARRQAEKGLAGRMEGHAAMGDMGVSHYFVMDWASVWTDIVLGLLIAGAVAAWVPASFFQAFFFTDHPLVAAVWGPLVGPIIAVLSFVCSVGNVPLAAVLWNGGISFGGVVSFIFADLIVLPILRIYVKYYGFRMAAIITGVFYVAMAGAGYLVEGIFWLLGLTPHTRNATVLDPHISFNYTSVLNVIFLVGAALLLWRFLRTGGPHMLRMMADSRPAHMHDSHQHHMQ